MPRRHGEPNVMLVQRPMELFRQTSFTWSTTERAVSFGIDALTPMSEQVTQLD